MVKYIFKRILLSILILLGVSVILYGLLRCMPLNYVEQKFFSNGNLNMEDHYEKYYQMLADSNLAKSDADGKFILKTDADGNYVYSEEYPTVPEVEEMPIMEGYFQWLTSALHGDFGESWKYGQPVSTVIFKNMGVSFIVALISLILQLIIAIPLGIKSACNQYSKLDYSVTVLTMIGISFPSFFFGRLVIKYLAEELRWFPVGGLVSSDLAVDASSLTVFLDKAWHLALPIFVLTILSIGSLMRYTRTNTLEVLSADYIRTARAKGLSERTVVYKHAFRNTMIPVVTMLAGTLPSLFGGAMITEQIFDIPGIGNIAYQALQAGDIPFVMGYNMFIAVLTVAGVLLADVMYAVVDPRVKLS